ncbi:MAG: hypothetical protein OXU20_28860 [Myxococcales bacterium]|nr:hypothetical protein [Myxococcales bacterium]
MQKTLKVVLGGVVWALAFGCGADEAGSNGGASGLEQGPNSAAASQMMAATTAGTTGGVPPDAAAMPGPVGTAGGAPMAAGPAAGGSNGQDGPGSTGAAGTSSPGGMMGAGAETTTTPPANGGPSTNPPGNQGGDGASGTEGTGGEADGEFAACVAGLQAMCPYDAMGSACSSLVTTQIPLTDGGTWGNNEIVGGPYGAFVEWNQGEAFANPENPAEGTCEVLARAFGEPEVVTADVLNLRGMDLKLYTIFRPACWKDGETYPVITWGNGTCGQSGGYAGLLATVASHGFVVIAANSRFTNAGNNEMLRALDLAAALNADESSIFYQKLDLDRVGAMGHSQGSAATVNAAMDPRVKAAILWNGGASASKPYLAVSGDRDLGGVTAAGMDGTVQGSSQPAAWLFYHQVLVTGGNATGHLTLMEQPERVWEPTVAWWKYMLNGDEEAKKMFVGPDCGLCNRADEFEYKANANLN